MYDNETGDRSTYALCGADSSLRYVKPTCAAHKVCDDDRKYRSVGPSYIVG